jgi:hypothetical protein
MIRRATSVASVLIDETAACRPQTSGFMVWGKKVPPGPDWAVALEAKPKPTSALHMASVLSEVVMQSAACLSLVLIPTLRAFCNA